MSEMEPAGVTVDDFASKLESLFEPKAEAPAEVAVEETPEETPVEETTTEETPVEAVETPVEPVVEKLYAGKYKSPEELEEAYQNLNSVMGRQGNEMSDLRQKLDHLESRVSQPTQAPYSQDQIMEAAEGNPMGTAVWALQNAPHTYEGVMEVWYENNPKDAARFEQHLAMESLKDDMRKEIAPVAGPVTQMTQQQEFYSAWTDASKTLPDLNSFSQQIIEAAEETPEILGVLQNGDHAAKTRVITSLYWMARGRSSDTLAAAQQQVDKEAEQKAQEGKTQATVIVSPGKTNADTASSDARVREWKNQFRKEAGLPLLD